MGVGLETERIVPETMRVLRRDLSMFTLADICDIAIQIERNGESAYREAAEKNRIPEVVKLLEMLAEDEARHAHWFEQIDVNQPFTGDDEQIAEMGRELLQGMMAPHTFSLDKEALADAGDIQDVIHQSLEFEKDTILFYEMLSGFLDDDATKNQLAHIIEEERSHIEKLNEIVAYRKEVESRIV
jgi:rubrerythrin